MNKMYIVGLVLCLCLTGIVSAGTIENDCTAQDRECVDGYWSGHGWSRHWVCTEYQDVCEDSITTETNIDSDTLNGQSNQAILDQAASYSDSHDNGGASSGWVTRMLNELEARLNLVLVPRTEYNLLLTWAESNGFDKDNPVLISQCTVKYGDCGDYVVAK